LKKIYPLVLFVFLKLIIAWFFRFVLTYVLSLPLLTFYTAELFPP
jgi:hypothetical protein